MSALTYLAPDFIKEGRLCWLRSPLYIVTNGKNKSFYFSDEEYNKVKGKTKGEVIRCKGLGTLEPDEARLSMFSPEYQRLDIISYDDKADNLLKILMGESAALRKDFIFKNIDFSEVRE